MDWWDVKNKSDIYYAVDYHEKDPKIISFETFATYEDGYLYLLVIKY
ncbi:MAG: hypothetical protein NTU73_05930 [Ignavibacteriae bacterium]|nr:hypothetical protein [Ignavibacteriota bacterium]